MISRKPRFWGPASIAACIAASRAALASASSSVSIVVLFAVFMFTGLLFLDAGWDGSEVVDLIPIMSIFVVFGVGYLGQEELCSVMFLRELVSDNVRVL